MIFLAQGDLAGASAALAEPPRDVDLPGFVAYMATYWDLYWALTSDQRALVKRLTATAFDGDRGTWGLALAGAVRGRGRYARAAAYGDRPGWRSSSSSPPPRRTLSAGCCWALALAYMGRKEEAIREGQRGVALLPVAADAQAGPYTQHQLARIYILLGEPEKALDQLEPLLRIPVLSLAGVAQARPDLRSPAEEPAVPQAGGGEGINTKTPPRS